MRHRWRRRILTVLATTVLMMGVGLAYCYHLARSAPSWYHPSIGQAQRRIAANQADQKFAQLFSWASDVHAQMIRWHLGAASAGDSVGPQTFKISEDELNSFIDSWPSPDESQLRRKMAKYFTDGRIGLRDGRIILAGQSTEWGVLASASFEPSIDPQGQLHFALYQISAGQLPVPRAVVNGKVEQVRGLLQTHLPAYQQLAGIDSTFAANGHTTAAAMTQMMLNGLDNQPSLSVVFIPFDLKNLTQTVPVKLSAISVEDGAMTATLDPMSVEEESAVLARIKGE